MIITIDTSKDSHTDLKKLIKFLQHHVGETNTYDSNSLDNSDIPTPSAGMFDMFGNDNSPPSDSESLLNDDEQDEEPEERISIMPY